ncbi:MAG: radical SAM protein [Deltaproteobacteria bacterium]
MPLFRPPSEGESFILQATIGCSHNDCTYCAMYRRDTQKFRMRSMDEIRAIVDEASAEGAVRRVFIADGNALIIPQKKLLQILGYLQNKCPSLERVRMYANVSDILRKGAEDMAELRAAGLDMVYIGFESGDDAVLARIKKGANYDETVRASKILKKAGVKNSAMVLLGVGGVERSVPHAQATGRLLSDSDPEYVGALSLQIRPGAPIHEEWVEGKFALPEKFLMIRELEIIVEGTNLTDGYFFSNHISNFLPIKAKFPEEKGRVLEEIRGVLANRDEAALRPDFYRDVINQY